MAGKVKRLQHFRRNSVQGKAYDTLSGEGARLWEEVRMRLEAASVACRADEVAEPVLFGELYLVRPRLGQESFRVLVTDLYQRRCAVTGEKGLPVLEAAHIREVKEGAFVGSPRGAYAMGRLIRPELSETRVGESGRMAARGCGLV